MKQALQQGFTSRSRWLLQILGLKTKVVRIQSPVKKGASSLFPRGSFLLQISQVIFNPLKFFLPLLYMHPLSKGYLLFLRILP